MKDKKEDIIKSIDCNLLDFIRSNSAFNADDEILSYAGISYDYKRFCGLVDKTIRILSSIPYLQSGDKVVIGLVTSPETIALIYACNYISLVPVLVDVRLSAREYRKIIIESGSKIAFLADFNARQTNVISDAPCLKKLFIVSPIQSAAKKKQFFWGIACFFLGSRYMFQQKKIPKLSTWAKFLQMDPGEGNEVQYTMGTADTEIIFATSGSTGKRKFVIQTARALNYNVLFNEFYFDMKDPSITSEITILPIFACSGFSSCIHMPLYYGKKIFVHQVYDFRKMADAMIEIKPNIVVGSVGMWEHFLHSEKINNADLSFLKICICSGEKVEEKRLAEMNSILEGHGSDSKLLQVYGMTELTVVSLLSPDDYNPSSVGKPIPMVDVCVVDEGTENELPIGSTGEICVHSMGMMKGYWQNSEATEKALRAHSDGRTYLHTGDIGRIDDDGFLFFEGRMKNIHVSISGTKIFTPEIEESVREMDGITNCAAVVCKSEGRNDVTSIILFAEIQKGSPLNRRAVHKIMKHCHETLPMFLMPDKVVVMDQIPVTSSGKTDYQSLQQQADAFAMKQKITVINVK